MIDIKKVVAVIKNCKGSASKGTQEIIAVVLDEYAQVERGGPAWFALDVIRYELKTWRPSLDAVEAAEEKEMWARYFDLFVKYLEEK